MAERVNIQLYIMAKPECNRFLDGLEAVLDSFGLWRDKVYRVNDWEQAARAIYEPQLEVSHNCSREGFESHIWVNKHLFGNNALVMTLENSVEESLEQGLKRVHTAKEYFRRMMKGCYDNTFFVCINTEQIDSLKGIGESGSLGCMNERFVPFCDCGTWDYVFFKYVHSPDPQVLCLEYEWKTMCELGIFRPENVISMDSYELMKRLKTLIPPGELK